ncbi:PREDICTED: uncharacterized protein LOC104743051 isoform X3 [Camelina sativa]|uniref:Uncharacterized protein LOC104743051 isoform X3 n=1 Tax=Camelina sativa TaxID=90675 RepID=A0ABM1QVT2_CAMSA|nr:PREDICTED: uncharacterized protein LOC104743051 isoform X3 [Camelina sativa]
MGVVCFYLHLKSVCVDVSSIEQDLDSLRVVMASLKDDLASLTATVKSTLDLMPSKEELLAMVTTVQELAKKLAKIPAVSVAQVTSSSKDHHKKLAKIPALVAQVTSSSKDHKKKRDEVEEPAKKEKSDEGEEPAKKKAKSDTNYTYKKANITRPFPVYADAHPLEKNAQVGEIVEFERQPGGSYDGGILFV